MSIEARFQFARKSFLLDVNFQLSTQGITALFGPSGCGKTTLLRLIAGLERCTNGYLKVGNQLWQDSTQFVAPHHRPIGYVFQEASLFPHLSVQKNLEYGFKRIAKDQRNISFTQAVDLLGLASLLKRSTHQLSGGERQRVAIGRALLTSPRLLLMDEPLAALDDKSKSEIIPFIEQLHNELTLPVLYVSHSPDEVAKLANYLLLIEKGKTIGIGPVNEMLTRTDLPLAHRRDAEAVIEASVVAYDATYHLTYLEFSGGRLTVAGVKLPKGNTVRLRILARDVSLSSSHHTGTSILNIFAATITELIAENSAQMLVQLDAAGTPILARITHKSVNALGLKPGLAVYAQVKSVAVLL